MPQSVSSASIEGSSAIAECEPPGRIRRKRRRRALAEVREDEPHAFLRRIAARGHLAREVRVLGRHLYALAAAVELPAVIQAAQRVALDPAEVQLRAAVRAAVVHYLGAARLAAVERVVLAHDADRLGMCLRQVFAAVDREPELAHEAPARGAGTRRGEIGLVPIGPAFGPPHDAAHRPNSSANAM